MKAPRAPAANLHDGAILLYLARMTPTAAGASRPSPIPDHVQAMETALKLLHATGAALADSPATTFDVRPLAQALERAVTALLDAYDARRDPVAAIREAMVYCDEAAREIEQAKAFDEGLEGLVEWVEAARNWLLTPEQAFGSERPSPPAARDLVVSHNLPRLHQVERASIAPIFRVATPLPPRAPAVATLASELAALAPAERMKKLKEQAKLAREQAAIARDERARAREARRRAPEAEPAPRPGFTKDNAAPLSPEAFTRSKARELFEDIAAMGLQRTPLLGDFWRGAAAFDQRLLRDIDAFAALGATAAAHVETLVFEHPAKDASVAFALGITLGSIEGRDALAAVERGLRFIGTGEKAIMMGMAAALKLSPHPELPVMLQQWSKDDDAALRALAIDVLCHRGWATAEEIALACQDSSEAVVACAIMHAAYADIPQLGALIEQHAQAKTPELCEALAWAMVIGSVSYPLDRLREKLASDGSDHVLLPIAIAGDEPDAGKLVDRFAQHPTRQLALALGYAGHPLAIGALCEALEKTASPELKEACAFALQRLTGAELYEQVDVPPENLDVDTPDDPPLPDDQQKLTRRVSDRRDRPGKGSPDRLTLPTTRPEAWRAFIAEHGVQFQGARRLRRGKPYTPAQSLQEIDSFQITPGERRVLYREVLIKTGKAVTFDPVDFIVSQEAALSAMAPHCEKASSQPGAWGRALRQR